MRAVIPFLLSLWAAPMALADTALLIANGQYDDAQNLRYADEIAALQAPLSEAGFDVIVVENGSVEAMRAGVSALLNARERERILIAVAGHMVRARSGTWVMAQETSEPDLGTVGGQGVALDVLMEVASATSGRAVLLLGQEPRRIDLGRGVARGLGRIEVPQGVTVLSGAPDDLAEFTLRTLLQPGANMAEAVRNNGSIRSHGFLPAVVPFTPEAAPEEDAPAVPALPSQEEVALWQAVRELNTAGAYLAYLQQYPNGAFAAEARNLTAALEAEEADPLAEAEAAEVAIGLTREDRQVIQRALTILDYDPRGIDGIFGRGTRAAIRAWQGDNNFDMTGFLTLPQIRTLREQGAVRAAQLEEEDRRRQEELERADRAFWQATGQGQSEDGLRRYLERYPQGLFAEVAQQRLDEIEAIRLAEAEAQERADWDAVRGRDTIDAYQRYLQVYPQGLFVEIARARIAEIEGRPNLTPQQLAQAEAREAALNLPQVTRLLIERRLANMGFDPGGVDGRFNPRTRSAIARYQGSRGLPATGYLNQITVVRLLAEAIGGR